WRGTIRTSRNTSSCTAESVADGEARLGFSAAMAHQRDVVDELAETVDGDADDVFRLRGVRVGWHDRRAREQPRAERQAVGRIEHADELLRLAGHVGDG